MISKPRYRFFLGGQQISEPVGWNSIRLVMERDTVLWSLIESVEQPFEFVADGYDYIKDARRNGINSQITFESDISWDGGNTWEEFFNGLLDLTTLIEIENKRRFQCTLLRTGSWSKFMNKRGNQVNIWGKAASHTTDLPSQKLRKVFHSETYPTGNPNAVLITYITDTAGDKYGIIDLNNVVTDELEYRYGLSNGVQSSPVIPPFFKAKEEGSYVFDIEIWMVGGSTILTEYTVVDLYIQFGDNSPIGLTQTNFGVSGLSGESRYTYSGTQSLVVGETIKLWIQDDSGGAPNTSYLSPLDPNISFIDIVADTEAAETQAEGFFIHDATRAIVNEITEDPDYFYSAYFAGLITEAVEYDQAGCGFLFKLFKGINVRGESLDDHPFTFSFDDMWQGIDNIFCLGAGYEYVTFVSDGQTHSKEVLRIEQRDYFFDDSTDSVELEVFNWDENLEISYDPQFLITAIKAGFSKWEAETLVGTDDPQTVHDYSTILKTAGAKDTRDKKILSSFYAASSGIEETRRRTFEPRKDWRLDEETFIIQTDLNGDVRTYSSSQLTNLLNDDSRYNIRLTPANTMNRWASWLSIAFQEYPEQLFYFEGGQGNINMIYDHALASGCDAVWGRYVNERGNVDITTSPFKPFIYKFVVPFNWSQWKAVRDNRKNSIRLNYRNNEGNTSSVSLFIKTMEYEPNQSFARFECWLKNPSPLLMAESSTIGNWEVSYSAGVETITLPSPGGSGSIVLKGVTGTVEVTASKKSNLAEAEANGSAMFYKNDVLEYTDNFNIGDNCTSLPYFYTDLDGSETLKVVITEI